MHSSFHTFVCVLVMRSGRDGEVSCVVGRIGWHKTSPPPRDESAVLRFSSSSEYEIVEGG